MRTRKRHQRMEMAPFTDRFIQWIKGLSPAEIL